MKQTDRNTLIACAFTVVMVVYMMFLAALFCDEAQAASAPGVIVEQAVAEADMNSGTMSLCLFQAGAELVETPTGTYLPLSCVQTSIEAFKELRQQCAGTVDPDGYIVDITCEREVGI